MLRGLAQRQLARTGRSVAGSQVRLLGHWPIGTYLAPAVALFLALLVRLPLVAGADFPLNDGGLFFVMTREIDELHYALPVSTSYNLDGIPFAYPPLAFYLAAAVARLTHTSLIDVMRALPLIANLLTVAAFCVLARSLLRSPLAVLCAATAFALLPRGYEWLIMGGGLTRSLGFLLAIVCLTQARALWEQPTGWRLAWCASFAALTVLTHLEMGLFALYSLGLFFLCYGQPRRDARVLGLLVGSVALLTAPWWLTVIGRHGLAPFLAASDTAGWSRIQVAMHSLVDAMLPTEPLPGLIGALAGLGIAALLGKQSWLLPAWLPLIFLLTPRSAATEGTVPLALLAAVGLVDVVLKGLGRALAELVLQPAANLVPLGVRRACRPGLRADVLPAAAALVFPLVFLLDRSLLPGPRDALGMLPSSERAAMEWVAAHTPASSTFLVLSSKHSWEEDYVAEWFPVLAQRRSSLTVQGAEWLPAGAFAQRTCLYNRLRDEGVGSAAQLDEFATRYNIPYSHVYMSKSAAGPVDLQRLQASLLDSPEYAVVYDSAGALLLARTGPTAVAAPDHRLPITRDCQSLYDQPPALQATFYESYGARAPWVWLDEHTRETGGWQ